jgi:hypothetical protein
VLKESPQPPALALGLMQGAHVVVLGEVVPLFFPAARESTTHCSGSPRPEQNIEGRFSAVLD